MERSGLKGVVLYGNVNAHADVTWLAPKLIAQSESSKEGESVKGGVVATCGQRITEMEEGASDGWGAKRR